jgi:hypothetical protein
LKIEDLYDFPSFVRQGFAFFHNKNTFKKENILKIPTHMTEFNVIFLPTIYYFVRNAILSITLL